MKSTLVNDNQNDISSTLTKENTTLNSEAIKKHYIDQESLSIFVDKLDRKCKDENKEVELKKTKNGQAKSGTSSELDNEENLDKMSTTAIDDNTKKNRRDCDFMTPKKKGKNFI